MTKICHITSLYPAKDTRIFQKECVSLAAHGFDTHLLVLNREEDEDQGVKIHNVKASFRHRLDRMQRSAKVMLEKARQIDADIYHIHNPELIPLALRLKKEGKKIIFDSHENIPKQIKRKSYLFWPLNQLISSWYAGYERKAAAQFDGIIVANPPSAKHFEQVNSNVQAICNFPIVYEDAVQQWDEKKDELFYVGYLTRLRGIKELVQSMESIEQPLNLGGTWRRASFEEEVKALPGWARVRELGYLEKEAKNNYLKQSKVGVSILYPIPNYMENYSVKIFEYMSAGLAVIGTGLPLYLSILEEFKLGLAVKNNTPREIADAANYLFNHPEKARDMGQTGLEAIHKKYNWASEEQKLFAFYERILTRPL